MRLILLGAPGTGKGTQGQLLAKHYGIPNISTGDILRQDVANETELGVKAKQFMNAGELVPDDIMIGIIKQRLEQKDCTEGFILDGFPRTVPQAIALDDYLIANNKSIQFVIVLEVDYGKIVKRLSSRRVCRSCGKDYNIISSPPPDDNKCTKCGGEIWQRPDDNETTIMNRVQVYENKTHPLKSYYEKKGILKIIDGNDSIKNIQNSIREIFAQ